MSAIRITAEPNSLYLTTYGSRVRTLEVRAHSVAYYFEDQPEVVEVSGRSLFESWIESVLS